MGRDQDKQGRDRLLEALGVQTDADGCQNCLDQLDAYVAAQLAGQPYADLYPQVALHLDVCLDCAGAYARLYELELATVSQSLPQPQTLPPPDLRFLQPSTGFRERLRAAVKRAGKRLNANHRTSNSTSTGNIFNNMLWRLAVVGGMILGFLFLLQRWGTPETVVETVVQQVEVTQVVTETVVEEGETMEVTRVVTEVEEVEVTREVAVEAEEQMDQPVTLNLNWSDEPPALDPSLATDSVSINVITNVFVGLTKFDPNTGEVLPYMADSWESGEDADGNATWTFHLRDDIAWVKYNPVTGETTQEVDEEGNPRFANAHDVVYGVKRTIDPATASDYAYVLYIIKNAQAVNSGSEEVTIDDVGVVALDDWTVQFTLETPAAFFPAIAGMWVAHAMPQWTIEEHDDKWTEAGLIVTNGPYAVESWVHGTELNMVKNPLWNEADSVQIERVVGIMITEASTAFALYENNELDTTSVPLPEIDRVKADPVLSAEFYNAPVACTYYYGFTNTKYPFTDQRVRQAFSQAIDRQSLIDNVLKGGQIPATSFAPPGIFGAPEPGTVGLGYDPEAAAAALQSFLDEEGLTIEDFNALGIVLMHNTSEAHAQIAAAIQQMWSDVLGVEVTVENQEWAVYLDTIRKDTPVEEAPHIWSLNKCADYPDENNWVYEVFNSDAGDNRLRRNCVDANCSETTTSEFDEITVQAQQQALDLDERIALYAEVERLLSEVETAYAPIYHYTTVQVTKPWLTRNFPNISGIDVFNWTLDMDAKLAAQGG